MFNDILVSLRLQNKMTQEELARKIGVVKTTIANYESGLRNPDNEKLIAISKVFNVSIDYLLGLDSKTPSTPILMDDFTYALYNETKELTDKQKQAILDMAKAFKDSQK